MTFYLTPYGRRYMRRVMHQMNDIDEDLSNRGNEILFPVDVRVEDDKYVLTALLPGIRAEELNIQIVNETVSLQGEFKDERKEGVSYLVQERPSGRFCRVISLPERVDSAKAEASMENGVLVLEIPKAEEVRPKMIRINAKK